jgi:hypothetical protein
VHAVLDMMPASWRIWRSVGTPEAFSKLVVA